MGKDICMYLIDNKGNIINDNLYNGRNYHWFDNITGRVTDPEYNHYPAHYGLPKDIMIPKKIKDEYIKDYYDFYYMKLKDYVDWFNKYEPDIRAGYFTEYDRWLIENKGYIPDEDEVLTHIENIEHPEVYTFMTYENIYNPDKNIISNIDVHGSIEDYYIIYYFDC